MTRLRQHRIIGVALGIAVATILALATMIFFATVAEAVTYYYYAYVNSTTGCRVYLNGTPYLVWVEHLHTYRIQCRWIP